MKLDTAQLEAVSRLQGNHEFGVFRHALEAHRLELLEHLVYGKEEDLPRLRGMAQAITEVLRALSKAPENYRKTRGRS